MTPLVVLVGSIVLQFTAAALALRLIRITGRIRAWILVSIAFAVMGLRRSVTLYDHLNAPASHPLNFEAELLALLVSILLVAGVYLIGPVFRRLQASQSELMENRSILQGLLDHSPTIIAVRDVEGRFVMVNQAYREAFGIGDADVQGRTVDEFRTPEFAARVRKYDRRVIEQEAPFTHEHETQLFHGQGRFISVRFPIRDEKGKVAAVGTISTDVTVESAVQNEIKSQSERYERATTAGRIGIWDWNPITDEKYVTPNWERLVGCDEGEHIKSMQDWLNKLDPSCRPDTNERLEFYRQQKQEVITEYPVILLDGTTFWFETRVTTVFDDDGKLVRVLGLDTDITARKDAESRLQEREAVLSSVIDNLPVGLVIRDNDLELVRMNKTFKRWYDVADADIETGSYHRHEGTVSNHHWVQRDRSTAISQEQEVLSTGSTLQRQLERTFADGEDHTIRITKFPIFDAEGRVDKVGSISVDLTELVHAHAELEKINRELEAASRAKTDFLAHMSHELRTPLNSVIGFSQIMTEQTFGPINNDYYLDYAKHIQTSAQHLLSLINDILDISKVEAGEADLNETVIDVRDCVSDSLKLIPKRLRDKSHNISVSIPVNEVRLLADERLVRQVLVNLISNALKFTPEGGQVEISTRRGDGGEFQLLVQDEGIGMAPADIPQALAPFGQVRRSAEISHGGTGLGLPLSKQLMELHGGSLNIKSDLGVGTTIVLTFPASRKVSEPVSE